MGKKIEKNTNSKDSTTNIEKPVLKKTNSHKEIPVESSKKKKTQEKIHPFAPGSHLF